MKNPSPQIHILIPNASPVVDKLISILTINSEITVKIIAVNCFVIDNAIAEKLFITCVNTCSFSKSINDNRNKEEICQKTYLPWWNLFWNNDMYYKAKIFFFLLCISFMCKQLFCFVTSSRLLCGCLLRLIRAPG